MTRLLFFAGTSRVGSVNWRLAGAAADLAKRSLGDRASVICIELTELDLPRHAAAADGQVAPGVAAFRDAVNEADGLFITSDEYTGTYSTVLKNALAWLKRDEDGEEAVLAGMPVALCGASIGGVRALRGQPALQQLFEELGATVIPQHLPLGTSPDPFETEDHLLPKVERQLSDGCLAELADRASERAAAKGRASSR